MRAVAVDTRSRMILELSTALVFLAGICCYAGVSHLHIGLSRPRDLTHTSFGILCLLIATSALITSMAQSAAWPSESPLFAALRGLVVVLFGMVFPWFTAVYTGVRSRALPAAIALVYGLSWLANFVAPALLLSEPNLGPAMGTPYTLGDPRLAGVGLHWAGHVLLFVHLYYACWEQYRRGERRRALALAGSAVPLLATTVANALVMVGLIDFIYTRNFGFMALVVLMSLTLCREIGRKSTQIQTVLDNVPAVIFMKDRWGRYLLVNRQFERLHGLGLEEVRGRTDTELFGAERGEQAQTLDRQVLESGQLTESEEVVQHDGHTRIYSSIRFPLTGSGGACYGLCGISTDMSERIAAAVALRQLASNMESLANRRTAELAAVNRELEAFTYSVSHDLRAPLTTINGYAELLLRDHARGLGPDGRRFAERIRDSALHMTRLIEDLLTLAKHIREPLHAQPVNLSELALTSVLRLQEATPQRYVEVVMPDVLPAYGDPRLLAIAIDNLLGNAWKYTAHTANPRVEIGLIHGQEERVFFVADNGAGFDPRKTQRLFQPFTRLHSAREFPGTGVGLSTAERIIRRHGGRIWANGKPGRGATFYFTLPEGPAQAPAPRPAEQRGASPAAQVEPILETERTGTG
ncbi:MAG: hypothetical protein DIU71_07055 [Proteobacteria bacterium]|nr:MAG: hypothetical protein DIU71_07055 [Pseudomonadota bacterium]